MIRSLSRLTLLFLIAGLIAVNVLVWRAASAPRVLTVHVFETGKGRAVFATTPSGRTLLIDSNSDASILRTLGTALPPWQRSLDVVLSLKSGAGLAEIEQRYKITKLFGGSPRTKSDLVRGARLNFHDGTFIDVLWPPNKVSEPPVLLLSYGSTSFLIKPLISPHTEKYLSSLDIPSHPPSLVISSTTPTNIFISNGSAIADH